MNLSILYEKMFMILDICSNLTEGACANPDILKIIMFIQELLKIVFFIVPIGLMVMLAIDLIKNVMASKDDEQKKNISLAVKRAIFCIAIFFVPTIVNVVNSLLIEVGVGESFVCCLENANSEYIEERTEAIAYKLYEEALQTVNEIDPNAKKKVYKNAVNKANGAILELDSYIYKIKNETKKADLENKVDSLRNKIKEKEEQR